MWTKFYDTSSGGREKLGACTIWIEAGEDEATVLFEQMFGRDPHNVTCSCCGPDYSVSEVPAPRFFDEDWVVTAADIKRFEDGHGLPAKLRSTDATS